MKAYRDCYVGGAGGKGGSVVDPPVAVPVIEIKHSKRVGYKEIINRDGSRRTWTTVDLNVCFNAKDDAQGPKNLVHWGPHAFVREIMANAIDAAFEANYETWNGSAPKIDITNTLSPLAGHVAINGKLGASWAVNIERVASNPKHKVNYDNALLPPKYIEESSKNKRKSRGSTSSKISSSGDFDNAGDSDDDDDAGENDDDDDNVVIQPELDEENAEYRVALFIRSFSVLPLEAWVNAYSTKNESKSALLRETLIGGFGMGLKDSMLAAFVHFFRDIQIFVNEPREKDPRYCFYRGLLENTNWSHHFAPTLNMKIKFSGCPTKRKTYIPNEITKMFKGGKAPSSAPSSISAAADSAVTTAVSNSAPAASTAAAATAASTGSNTKKAGATGSGEGTKHLPSTVVMIASVVKGKAEAEKRAKVLWEAISAHRAMGPVELFTEENFKIFFEKEFKRISTSSNTAAGGSSSGSSSAKSSSKGAGRATGSERRKSGACKTHQESCTTFNETIFKMPGVIDLSSSPVPASATSGSCDVIDVNVNVGAPSIGEVGPAVPMHPPRSTIAVRAPCVHPKEVGKMFYAEVSVVREPCNYFAVHNWPGFQLLKCENGMEDHKGITACGSRFSDIVLRLPLSYKKTLQRDRVVYYGMCRW
jgi:hypothetical protein